MEIILPSKKRWAILILQVQKTTQIKTNKRKIIPAAGYHGPTLRNRTRSQSQHHQKPKKEVMIKNQGIKETTKEGLTQKIKVTRILVNDFISFP